MSSDNLEKVGPRRLVCNGRKIAQLKTKFFGSEILGEKDPKNEPVQQKDLFKVKE